MIFIKHNYLNISEVKGSPPAPKFHIISRPNGWAKAIKTTISHSKLTDTKLSQLEFWNKFKEYAQSKNSRLRLRKTHPQHWYDISLGTSLAHIALTVNTRTNEISCMVYIDNNQELYDCLYLEKEKIEKELNLK